MNEPDLVAAMFRGMAGGAAAPSSRMASHMPALYVLARERSWGYVVELGVGAGWSTVALLAGARSAGRWLMSYDIDASMRPRALEAMGLPPDAPMPVGWEFCQKNSVDAAGDFPDGSVSLWFLDTEHTYEATVDELRVWLPKIHRDGVMCGHDYYLHKEPGWEMSAGVQRAVDDFAAGLAGRFSLQVLPNDMGLFILWPK